MNTGHSMLETSISKGQKEQDHFPGGFVSSWLRCAVVKKISKFDLDSKLCDLWGITQCPSTLVSSSVKQRN